jgi:hypothetical protein
LLPIPIPNAAFVIQVLIYSFDIVIPIYFAAFATSPGDKFRSTLGKPYLLTLENTRDF